MMITDKTFIIDNNLMDDFKLYNMSEVAKYLDLGYGRNTLLKNLRFNQILDKHNQPFRQYINQGYFKLVTKERPGQPYHFDSVTLVTFKGLQFIKSLMQKTQ
ncbi:MAG: phage antirepressor KilAC domain-containing protein [Bacteroidales bacterium]|nr:phage antirepressor KilAC domain-containing protein [Bacteroidales bacterium]